MKRSKTVIGRLERVDLPHLEMKYIEAKVDTGAYSSTIHCQEINEDVESKELFVLFDDLGSGALSKIFTDYTSTSVRSSFGVTEDRFVIKTRLVLGDMEYDTEFTLTDRSNMKYQVLLGRKAITGLLVDVSKSFLLEEKKKTK